MDLWLWKEELVPDAAAARVRVRNGMAFLDKKVGPGWHEQIDIERLDIASPFRCVLAQLAWKGKSVLATPRRCVDCGFACGIALDFLILFLRVTRLDRLLRRTKVVHSYALLNEAWKEMLLKLRERAAMTWAEKAAERFRRSKLPKAVPQGATA